MHLVVRSCVLGSMLVIGALAAGCPAAASAQAPVPAPAESPEQVVLDVAHGLSEGRPLVIWDALPASYQNDVTELVHSYAASVDRDLWNQGFAIVRKIGSMLQNQKDVILAMPKFRDASEFNVEDVSRQWDAVVAPIMTITQSELADVATLEHIDIRQFLATTGTEFMRDITHISALAADDEDDKLAALGRTKASLVSRDGDIAVVAITQPGRQPHHETFVRVEGKWIPKSMADDWNTEMHEAQERIAQMSTGNIEAVKPKILAILSGIDATVDRLDAAQTPEEFETSLQMGVFQVFGGVMEVAQAMQAERGH